MGRGVRKEIGGGKVSVPEACGIDMGEVGRKGGRWEISEYLVVRYTVSIYSAFEHRCTPRDVFLYGTTVHTSSDIRYFDLKRPI